MGHRRLTILLGAAFAMQTRIAMGQMQGNDWQAVAARIVERMALTSGERVFLLAEPGLADSLIEPLRARVRAAGGIDLGAVAVRGVAPAAWQTDWTRRLASLNGAALDAELRTTDLGVMLPGPVPADTVYAAMQNVLRNGHGRTIHFHWAGAYAMDGTLLPMTPARSRHYQEVLLGTDYARLGRAQEALERAMRGASVRVTTPAGTDLSFRIGDRQVTKQDGDASLARTRSARVLIDREIELPAGAIRVAPVEESVNGKIAFPASDWGGERVEGLVMTFANGRLTGFVATRGRAGVEKELTQGGDPARAFREFALGLNPLLAILPSGERWIPYYGYGAGVVRLSLGDNTELGGKVGGGYLRWNFFSDATVRIGDDVWVRGGRLEK
ncbi:MAG: hypothetical protein MNPFHGCM_02725 [Gemmatimonadaceae bacterium]|nr:hypothetical protein [Gemmatimonadaceae bacterium]